MNRPTIVLSSFLLILAAVGVLVVIVLSPSGGEDEPRGTSPLPEQPRVPIASSRPEVEARRDSAALDSDRASTDPRQEPERRDTQRMARLIGHVVDDAGRPVGDAEVRLGWQRPRGEPADQVQSARSDASGRFEFASAPAEVLLVLGIDHAEFIPLEHRDLRIAGESLELPALRLRRGAELSGRVVSARGPGPVEGAALAFEPLARAEGLERLDTLIMQTGGALGIERTTRSDAEGRFRLPGLWPVKGVVVAVSEDLGVTRSELVELDVDRPWTLTLSFSEGSLRLRILDDRGPVAGARVGLWDDSASAQGRLSIPVGLARRQALSDAEGALLFEGLGQGHFALRLRSEGHAELRARVRVEGATERELRLHRASRVRGRIASIGAPRPAQIEVELNEAIGQPLRQARLPVDEDGVFVLEGLAKGRYFLRVEAGGFAASESSLFEVEDGRDVEGVDVELRAECVVHGVVLDAAGREPIPGARLAVVPPPPEVPGAVMMSAIPAAVLEQLGPEAALDGEVRSDAQGRFRLGGLEPGVHAVQARHPERAPTTSASFVLDRPGESAEIVLRLGEGGTLHAEVCTSLGSIVPARPVLVRRADGRLPVWQQLSDDRGVATFVRLPAGEYRVALAPAADAPRAADLADPFANGAKSCSVEEGGRAQVRLIDDPASGIHGVLRGAAASTPTRVLAWSGRSSVVHWVEPEPDGRFELRGLSPGDFELEVLVADAAVAQRCSVRVRPGRVEEVVVDLPPHELRGRLVDRDGRGLAGARIRPRRAGSVAPLPRPVVFAPSWRAFPDFDLVSGTRSVACDEDGRFVLRGLPAGSCSLIAELPDGASLSLPSVLVPHDPSEPLVLVAEPPR